jgi:hypothetical protein
MPFSGFCRFSFVCVIPFSVGDRRQSEGFFSPDERLFKRCAHGFRIADRHDVPIESRILGFNKKEVVDLLRECCSQAGQQLARELH